ncbi:MAG TPA: hypothetical protein VGR64_04575 [Terracidiphilus sp.]|nr:hypothetical protein [Terracidiphilus sp.]
MNQRLRLAVVALLAAGVFPVCGFSPDPAAQVGADYIVTAAPVYMPLAETSGGERFPRGAQLLLVHDGKPEPLVRGFAASADADVFFNGKLVLFEGKKSPGDRWQIYEVTLEDRAVRQVLAGGEDAERPLYLPGGRMVWAQRTTAGFRLRSASDGHPMKYVPLNPTAGPGVLDLSYIRGNAFPSAILKDGRVLFEAGFPLGAGKSPEIYVEYADGSGVEAYRCDHGRARWGARQLASGDIVFTHGASLARFTSPLAHEVAVAAPHAEFAGSVAETPSGDWLLSARTGPRQRYVIDLWKPGAPRMRTVLAIPGENLVEPVPVAPRTIPPRFPSGLHRWNYANLLALDARLSREGDLKVTPSRVRLYAQDGEGKAVVMGTAPVAADGSFFVRVPSDRPIRFELLDGHGLVMRREHGWLWIRSGEQRICVGCHAGPERSFANKVPEVLLKSTTPVDLTYGMPVKTMPKTIAGGR